jgi:precorrin-4/cobalt-precorrin-4 C11-methyltransferase
MTETPRGGIVSFVGAGPGAADLITLRGAERLSRADVVVWASSLVPAALLEHARDGAEIHDSAAMTLEDVLTLYAANEGRRVVRLHSGDPALYGAVQEQVAWCLVHARSYEIVPGVSSLGAAAAVAGHELTLPGIAQSVVITRLAGRTRSSMPARESLAAFAAIGATTAVFLSGARPRQLQRELLGAHSAWTAATPALVVVRATWPDEQILRTTVGSLAAAIESTGETRTLLVLVGDALASPAATIGDEAPEDGSLPAGSPGRRSHLYDPAFAHSFRKRSLPGSTAGRPVRRR